MTDTYKHTPRLRLATNEYPDVAVVPDAGTNAFSMSLFQARLSQLGATFPTLRTIAGVTPWMPKLLDECVSALPAAQRHAGLLVLGIWNPEAIWLSGRFDLLRALGDWDQAHRMAFARFMADPFFSAFCVSRTGR